MLRKRLVNSLILAGAGMLLMACHTRAADAEGPATESAVLVLPKSAKAAEYLLGRLSNDQLLKQPPSEFVFSAWLLRPGIDKKFRNQSLQELARIRNSSPAAELARGLKELDSKGEEHDPVVRELAELLTKMSADILKPQLAVFQALETASKPMVRQTAIAARLIAGTSFDESWQKAESSPETLADLITAVSLTAHLPSAIGIYPRITTAARASAASVARTAAILSLPRFPHAQDETAKTLSTLYLAGIEPDTTLGALTAISKKQWDASSAEALVKPILVQLEKVAADLRTEPSFLKAIQFAEELASLLPKDSRTIAERSMRALGVRVVVLRTLREQMLYDKSQIVVEAGKSVMLIFENNDVMQHNLVVVAPGAIEEIGAAAELMRPEPDAEGKLHVPDSPKVLFATRMLNPGESARLSFTAPSEPGDYGYVCTYPGHWRRMIGKLAVVRDIETHLASNPEPTALPLTEWRMADFADVLAASPRGNVATGKPLFASLACSQCHRLGGEGYAFGPDLAGLFTRYQNDRAAVLREILEPSFKIDERYRNVNFDLKDGESIAGMIVAESADGIKIHSGPADVLIQELKPANIANRSKLDLSLMPSGLLNTLNKQQVIDLLAFLETDGAAPNHNH